MNFYALESPRSRCDVSLLEVQVSGKSTFITFGEIMLRLNSPDRQRLFQHPLLVSSFGGAEANVAVSLALLGLKSRFITAVPENTVGEACVRELRKYGVDTSAVRRVKNSRLGIYFLEPGANQRPSVVVYDREGSAVSKASPEDFAFPAQMQDACWLHLSGITPAVSGNLADCARTAAREARKAGAPVSLDLNFRKKLWNYGKKAQDVMPSLAELADVVIANETDIQNSLGIGAGEGKTVQTPEGYLDLASRVKARFPQVSVVAVTVRESLSADRNRWSAVLCGKNGSWVSRCYEIADIVDRVGAGDAFAAALIYGLTQFQGDEKRALDFAAAASCLKHSVEGDFNLSTAAEIAALCAGGGAGEILR